MTFGTKSISLFKAICLALVAACFLTLLMPWLSTVTESGMRAGAGLFSTGIRGRYTSFWSVMLILNGVLSLFLIGLAAFGLITDRKGLALPLSLVGLCMFFLALFQKAFIGRSLLHLGLGPWLLLLLSLAIPGLVILDNLAAKKPALSRGDFGLREGVPQEKKGSWVCPTCGVKHSNSMKFCDRCGTQRPEPPRCPACGRPVRPGESFCAECGAKL